MRSRKKQVQERKRLRFPSVLVFVMLITMMLGTLVLFTYTSLGWRIVDQLAENVILHFRSTLLNSIMIGFSWWGTYGTIVGWMGLSGWCIYKRNWSLLLMAGLLSLGGYAMGSGMKALIGRDRPTEFSLVLEVSRSFPSLHTLNSTIFYLMLTYLVYHFSRRFLLSTAIYFVSLVFIFSIGISRIYLGVHYMSDVVAGFLFGLAYFCFILLCFRIYDFYCQRSKK